MRKKIIILLPLLIVLVLVFGFVPARKELRERRAKNNVVDIERAFDKDCKSPECQDIGEVIETNTEDCAIVGTTKDTQAYKQVAGVDQNLLSLDVYTPKTKGVCNFKHPLMIYVHGGGWQIGDKAGQIKNKATYFPGEGYVFVSVNYRLAPAVMYPVFNQDVAAAVKWVYDNADKYSANNKNITIMGHSAGGGIISAVSTDEKYLNDVGLQLGTFRCAVSLDTEGYNVADKAAENTKVYQPAFGSDASVWPDASPINHISADKGIPSFFIVTRGNAERVGRAKAFQQKLIQSNIVATIIETLSLSHEGVNSAVGDPKDKLVTPKLQEFLDYYCR